MPYSLVLNLTPLSPISPNYLSGRHLHALFLTLVSSVDQELGNSLHDSQSAKAFTLSPLQTKPPSRYPLQWEHQKPIPPGTSCWWRISLLDETIFSKLTQLWLNLNPDRAWHLGSADLKITSILGTPQSTQPWANACPYEQLYDRASETTTQITFNFATPAAFRQGKYDNALPTPESVFNSLLNRWHKYSNIQLSEINLETIFPSYFDLNTAIITDSRSKFIGCIGEISYRIFSKPDPIVIKQINTLADFALYSGIGRKTTMGMGIVRRIKL
ncbi:MAG: CRISPR-associated endoribonuclease Cas6 [Oscillatoria sp. PMC 1068.18]|nr:CRISPR-associated endoribonuclease Cas6 [Oscillatoria sp. PMC 1076.18]MEC4987335.1 CRISPR-associated endoribonuclease Cas6 [Oscillatoria sp. PMC 1068.18]